MTHICPPDHKHGQVTTCYHTHGCRCEECRAATIARENRRRRETAYGRYRGLIPVRGVLRRIEGLYYLGWTTAVISERTGIGTGNITHLRHRTWVTAETFDTIDRVYRELVAAGVGPSTRSMKYARRKGWVSPYAWDNIDTDDNPVDARNPDRREMDPIAIELAIEGQPVTLNLREREEVIRRLNNLRWPDKRIGKHLGITGDTINRTRRRLGLPTWAYQDRATEYGQEHRETAA